MLRLIKLKFTGRVCFGRKSVTAICSRLEHRQLRSLIAAAIPAGVAEDISLCDAMPFLGDACYVAKPAFITEGLLDLSLADHKYHRVMKYLNLTELASFHEGSYNFAANAGLSFGRYVRDERGDRFEFLPEAGICFLLRANRETTEDDIHAICAALERGIPERLLPGCGSVQVSCCAAGSQWESLIAEENTGALLTLGGLDTAGVSPQALERLLEGAAYQAAYHPNGKSIVIQSGALIRNGAALPERIVCIEMRKLLCNEMYC